MPVSKKQLEANRRNARRSTGPTTETGKRAASMNAVRHGLTGTVTLMTSEDRLAHDTFTAEYSRALQPEGPVERELAEAIAENAWRLKRARSVDQNMYSLAHPALNGSDAAAGSESPEAVTAAAEARAFLADSRQFQLLTLYESRIQRSMDRNIARLETLQSERKAAREEALNEAQLLAKINYAEGLPYDPAADFPPENGFVFSTAEINRAIRRADRLGLVTFYENCSWEPFTEYRPPMSPMVEHPVAA